MAECYIDCCWQSTTVPDVLITVWPSVLFCFAFCYHSTLQHFQA